MRDKNAIIQALNNEQKDKVAQNLGFAEEAKRRRRKKKIKRRRRSKNIRKTKRRS